MKQIEFKGNKKFDDVNRNNVNRGDIDRRITVVYKFCSRKKCAKKCILIYFSLKLVVNFIIKYVVINIFIMLKKN